MTRCFEKLNWVLLFRMVSLSPQWMTQAITPSGPIVPKKEHHAERWIQEEWGRQNTGSLWEEKDIQLSLTFVSLVAVISDPNISVTIDSTKNLLCHNRCVQNSKSATTTKSLWKNLAWEGNTQHTALSLTAVGLVAVCQCGGRAWFGQRSAKWGILLLLLILLLPQRRGN